MSLEFADPSPTSTEAAVQPPAPSYGDQATPLASTFLS